MAVAAETAIRAWIMARPGLTGKNGPLKMGAFLNGRQPRSPAHGAYALLLREPGTSRDMTAEPGGPSVARITCHVYAGTIEAAETAATALCNAFQDLAGPSVRVDQVRGHPVPGGERPDGHRAGRGRVAEVQVLGGHVEHRAGRGGLRPGLGGLAGPGPARPGGLAGVGGLVLLWRHRPGSFQLGSR